MPVAGFWHMFKTKYGCVLPWWPIARTFVAWHLQCRDISCSGGPSLTFSILHVLISITTGLQVRGQVHAHAFNVYSRSPPCVYSTCSQRSLLLLGTLQVKSQVHAPAFNVRSRSLFLSRALRQTLDFNCKRQKLRPKPTRWSSKQTRTLTAHKRREKRKRGKKRVSLQNDIVVSAKEKSVHHL